MKKISKKISIAIGTAALAVGLMALPVLASTSQNLGNGNGTNMMSNQGAQASTTAGSSVLDSLVNAGTLTQDQENTILSSLQGMGNAGLKTTLDGLLTAGTITQEQEDVVLNAMQGTSMTGNHGSMQGTNMTSNHGSMQGTSMTGNHVSSQGKGMMSNRGSMSR